MKYSFTLFAVIYFLNECHGKCSDYYVVLQRTSLNEYILADMEDIDMFTKSYNSTKELKEIQKNKECIITKNVTVNECHASEPICTDNSTIQHGLYTPIDLSENNLGKDETKNMTENIEKYNNNVKNKNKKAPYTDILTKHDDIHNELNENGVNGTEKEETEINESSSLNANETAITSNEDQNNSKKVAIVVTSIAAASGVLFFVVKKLLDCLQQGVYRIPEPNTSV